LQYHVLCSHPGMRRGGRENPAHATYELGAHTPEQLHALLDEPAIVVVIGLTMTAEHIGQMAQAMAHDADAPADTDPAPDATMQQSSAPAVDGAPAAGAAGKPAKVKG